MSTPPKLVMCSCECAGAVFILVPYVVSFRNQKSTIFANEHDEQSITSLNTRDNVQRTTHFTVEPKANFDRCFFSRSQRCVHVSIYIHIFVNKTQNMLNSVYFFMCVFFVYLLSHNIWCFRVATVKCVRIPKWIQNTHSPHEKENKTAFFPVCCWHDQGHTQSNVWMLFVVEYYASSRFTLSKWQTC